MDRTFVVHSLAEVGLLVSVLFGVSSVQNTFFDYVWGSIQGGTGWAIPPPFRLPRSQVGNWNFSSFVVWTCVNMFGSFILHLPSLWTRRVQIRKPLKPLDENWYGQLKKPGWNPSNLCFPLVWIPAKLLKSVTQALVWESVGRQVYRFPILLSITSIVVADLWNQVFFVQHDKIGSVLIIWLLVLLEVLYQTIAWYYVGFCARFMYPAIIAIGFASVLNTTICWINRDTRNARQVPEELK